MQIITAEANVKVFILISWKHYQKVEGAPNDMTFYTAKPSKGSFVTLIGIGNEKVLIAGTQSSGTYQQYAHSEAARELDLHELLDKYGESSNYKNLANQIAFTQSQSSNSSESTSDEGTSNNDASNDDKVTRDNVIDKVEAYEGHQLDTDTYTFKNRTERNGDWGFSILDEEGNLEGSYIVTSDGEVTKYDENRGRNRVKVQSIVEIKNLENGNISQEIDNVSILKASVVFVCLTLILLCIL